MKEKRAEGISEHFFSRFFLSSLENKYLYYHQVLNNQIDLLALCVVIATMIQYLSYVRIKVDFTCLKCYQLD